MCRRASGASGGEPLHWGDLFMRRFEGCAAERSFAMWTGYGRRVCQDGSRMRGPRYWRGSLTLVFVGLFFLGFSGVAEAALSWSSPVFLDTGPGSFFSLSAVACPSATRCTAVDEGSVEPGEGGDAVSFNPVSAGTPTRTTIDSSGVGVLDAVACPSASQCTAVDTDGGEVTFNPVSPGTPTRTAIDSSGLGYLDAVACPSDGSVHRRR